MMAHDGACHHQKLGKSWFFGGTYVGKLEKHPSKKLVKLVMD